MATQKEQLDAQQFPENRGEDPQSEDAKLAREQAREREQRGEGEAREQPTPRDRDARDPRDERDPRDVRTSAS